MSTPLGLWRAPVSIPLRLSRQSLTEWELTGQCQQVQRTRAELEITRGAMYILSGIAGRSIVEPVRWAMLDGVLHMLAGALRTDHPQHQDLLAPTYGETLGVLIRALLLGGNVEIVRLLEGNSGKTPDFLLVRNTLGNTELHLVECKGTSVELHSTNRKRVLDVCRRIRTLRNHGRTQVTHVAWNELRAGGRLRLRWQRSPLATQASTCAVAVVVVPDARVLTGVSPHVQPAARRPCRGIRCVGCMDSGRQDLSANLVVAVDEDDLPALVFTPGGPFVDPLIERFVEAYRSGQRALWAEDDDAVAASIQSLSEIVEQTPVEPQGESGSLQASLALALAGYTDAALSNDLLEEEITRAKVADLTRQFRTASPRELDPSEFDRLIAQADDRLLSTAREESDELNLDEEQSVDAGFSFKRQARRSGEEVPPSARRESEKPRSRKPLVRVSSEYVRDIFARKIARPGERLVAPWLMDGIPGFRMRVDEFGGEQRIRVTAPESGMRAHEALMAAVDQIVEISDPQASSDLNWRSEYAELRRPDVPAVRMDLGRSWEANPLPSGTRPGITAWVGRDGRAEIIIRR
jgi:hypothetical protein